LILRFYLLFFNLNLVGFNFELIFQICNLYYQVFIFCRELSLFNFVVYNFLLKILNLHFILFFTLLYLLSKSSFLFDWFVLNQITFLLKGFQVFKSTFFVFLHKLIFQIFIRIVLKPTRLHVFAAIQNLFKISHLMTCSFITEIQVRHSNLVTMIWVKLNLGLIIQFRHSIFSLHFALQPIQV